MLQAARLLAAALKSCLMQAAAAVATMLQAVRLMVVAATCEE